MSKWNLERSKSDFEDRLDAFAKRQTERREKLDYMHEGASYSYVEGLRYTKIPEQKHVTEDADKQDPLAIKSQKYSKVDPVGKKVYPEFYLSALCKQHSAKMPRPWDDGWLHLCGVYWVTIGLLTIGSFGIFIGYIYEEFGIGGLLIAYGPLIPANIYHDRIYAPYLTWQEKDRKLYALRTRSGILRTHRRNDDGTIDLNEFKKILIQRTDLTEEELSLS